MKNIGNMLKEAQKLQSRMAEMQERLGQTEMSGSSGGGLVTVTLNGKGEMRKVNLRYRCSICGAEVKMTAAAEEEPEPPRHCLEDMELVAPIDE